MPPRMSDGQALILILIGAFGLLQVLRALAIRVRNEVAIHDLKTGVATLQIKNFRAAMLRQGIAPHGDEGDFDILDDDGNVIEAGIEIEPGDEEIAEIEPDEPRRRAA